MNIIDRYKQIRSRHWLQDTYSGKYAFVGIGNHSLINLYPVLQNLQVQLKYICCRSVEKLPLIEQKYPGVIATANLDDILRDEEVCGVFVSASPKAHFSIACRVVESCKSLFVEKPVCYTAEQLSELCELVTKHAPRVVMIGVQKRYSPLTERLVKQLKCNKHVTYNYRYTTGLYPEGNALVELFVHPLDYVSYLFGEAKILGKTCVKTPQGGLTYFLTLEHAGATGVLEISTAYSWSDPLETMTINTEKGVLTMEQMESLTFRPYKGSILGVPLEKVLGGSSTVTQIYERNNFVPSLANNQIYTQGYYNELKAFLDANERDGRTSLCNLSSPSDLLPTYRLIGAI